MESTGIRSPNSSNTNQIGTAKSDAPPPSPNSSIIENVKIEELPASIKKSNQELYLQAKVIRQDLNAKTADLQTKYGEVKIQTPEKLDVKQEIAIKINPNKIDAQIYANQAIDKPVKTELAQPLPAKPIAIGDKILTVKLQTTPYQTSVNLNSPILDKVNFAGLDNNSNLSSILNAKLQITLANLKLGGGDIIPKLGLNDINQTSNILNNTNAEINIKANITDDSKSNIKQIEVLNIVSPKTSINQINSLISNSSDNIKIGIASNILPNSNPILSTPEGNIILQTDATIPNGSRVIFKENALPQNININSLSSIIAPSFSPLFSQTWDAMEEALQVLNNQAPNVATTVSNTMPTPTAKMLPTALFFIAALKGGNIENWIGNKPLETLRNIGRGDLANKLGSDFSNIARQSNEAISGDWRVISMPMLNDENVLNMQFYLRSQDEQDSETGEITGKQTRFVLNISMSNMGKIQIDGLVKPEKLDVILRTKMDLDATTRQEMRQKFTLAIDEMGIEGSLSFQHSPDEWMQFELPKDDAEVLV